MAACMSGSMPQNCPDIVCPGCQRTFIYPLRPDHYAGIPALCPVCKGEGKVDLNRWRTCGTSSTDYAVCHSCNGKGWVTV